MADIPAQTIAEGSAFATINLDSYVTAVKGAGKEWKVGGTGSGQEDSILTAMMDKDFGYEVTYIPFPGGDRDWGVCAQLTVAGSIVLRERFLQPTDLKWNQQTSSRFGSLAIPGVPSIDHQVAL